MAALGLLCCVGFPLVTASGGYSLVSVRRFLIAVASPAAEPGLKGMLSCPIAHGIFPDQGSNPCLLYWQADSLPLYVLRLVMSNSLQHQGVQPARLLWPWGFSRQEYWSGLLCPPPGDLPRIKPRSPTLQPDSLLSEPPGKPSSSLVLLNIPCFAEFSGQAQVLAHQQSKETGQDELQPWGMEGILFLSRSPV